MDAASFLVGAAVLARATVGLPRPNQSEDPHESPARFWQSLREGWAFLRGEPVLLGLSLMKAVTNLLDLAWSAVLAPVWDIETGNGTGRLGLVFAVFAGSSAVGSLFAAAWGDRLPRFRTYLLAYLICGLPRFLVMAADSPLWLIMLIMVIGGVASGFLNPILGAVFFERIPSGLVGRVSSLSTSMCYTPMPLGGLVGGALVTWRGPVSSPSHRRIRIPRDHHGASLPAIVPADEPTEPNHHDRLKRRHDHPLMVVGQTLDLFGRSSPADPGVPPAEPTAVKPQAGHHAATQSSPTTRPERFSVTDPLAGLHDSSDCPRFPGFWGDAV